MRLKVAWFQSPGEELRVNVIRGKNFGSGVRITKFLIFVLLQSSLWTWERYLTSWALAPLSGNWKWWWYPPSRMLVGMRNNGYSSLDTVNSALDIHRLSHHKYFCKHQLWDFLRCLMRHKRERFFISVSQMKKVSKGGGKGKGNSF